MTMRVCGACGVRDPSGPCTKQVVLERLSYDHWLCAGEATRRRLSARPPLRLLKADGSEESVDEVELHNLKRMPDDESGCWYHIVPEALLSEEEEGTNDMVKRDVVRLCRYADGYCRSVATVASD